MQSFLLNRKFRFFELIYAKRVFSIQNRKSVRQNPIQHIWIRLDVKFLVTSCHKRRRDNKLLRTTQNISLAFQNAILNTRWKVLKVVEIKIISSCRSMLLTENRQSFSLKLIHIVIEQPSKNLTSRNSLWNHFTIDHMEREL